MTGIAMATFMVGASPQFLGLPADVIGEDIETGSNAVVTLTVSSNGTWSIYGNTEDNDGVWLMNGNAANYDVYVGVPMTTGTTDAWLNLGTTQEWTKVQTTNGSSSGSSSVGIKIRMASAPYTVLDTAYLSVRVQRS